MSHVVDLRKTKKTKKKKSSPKEIEWTAPEFPRHKKNKKWLGYFFLICLIFLIIAIFGKNFLFVIIIILAAFVLYVYSIKKPRKIKFVISQRGIQIDNKLYGFENLRSFWIFYNPPEIKILSLCSKRKFLPYLKIPLDKQDPVKIREFLIKFLPEKEHEESLVDTLTRKSGF